MPHGHSRSPMRSWWNEDSGHSNEIEHRLTVLEIGQDGHEKRHDKIDRRITLHEYILKGIIWALGSLATTKSGDVAEVLLGLLKVMKP